MALLTQWIDGLLTEGPFPPHRATAYRWLVVVAIVGSTVVTVLGTLPGALGSAADYAALAEKAALMLFAADYALRLRQAWSHPEPGALRAYVLSAYGIFDFLAFVPFLIGGLLHLPSDVEVVFGVIRFLKLARYSPALETLGSVVLNELKPLASALFIMMLLTLGAATMLYFAERDFNPGLASIPHALWWGIVTLATLGYGDVVPATALGKVLGSGVAVLGLCMFALPASILASGFTEEMRRQNFVVTWHLVAKVPFFARLQANQIAEIAALLKLQRIGKGEVLMREGDTGETMYFIVTGQVEAKTQSGAFVLKQGDFFGEIAILEQIPRTATVKALTRCHLLVLDARDFQKFMAANPALADTIWETARQRMGRATA